MKIVLVCNTDGALAGFRAPLIRALVARGDEVVTICGNGGRIDELRDLGARPVVVDFSRHSVSPLSNVRLFMDILRIIQFEQPDVVHSFTHKAVIYGSLAARLAKIRGIVGTVTGLGTLFMRSGIRTRLLQRVLVLQYRLCLPRRATILFQNPDDLREMVGLRAVRIEKSIVTGGSGIDLEEYPLPGHQEIDSARKMLANEVGADLSQQTVVVFPARGVREKGVFEFYAAAKELNRRHPDRFLFVHLGLVDSASKGALTAEDVDHFSKEHGVLYLGYKTNLQDYLIASDIVALPSYREGVPRSLIEALALGKSVVTSDAPGCRETVVDGWNGFLCEVRDSASLANSLEQIDSDFLEAAITRSRRLCEDRFDVRKLNATTFKLYGISSGT